MAEWDRETRRAAWGMALALIACWAIGVLAWIFVSCG